MRALVYGDSAPASGGWCYAETLREMGHEVSIVRDDVGLESYRSSLARRLYRKLLKRVKGSDRLKHAGLLLAEAERFQPHVIIVLKGLHLSHADVSALGRDQRWVCNINHDDFFSANPNNRSQIQRAAIPAYDFIFTTREVNVEEVRPLNSKVEFFSFAYYPRIHHPVDIPPNEEAKWNCDVVFVGTYERPRAALLEHLVRTTKVKLVIHGSQWGKLSRNSPLRKCVRSSDLRFDDLSKAIGGAGVALGFLRKENRDDYTQRTFEIPACGGVFLAERTDRHSGYYSEGIEAEFFDPDSVSELGEKIRLLLGDAEHREGIRKAGHEALLRGKHTYKDRLERLLQVYYESMRADQQRG